MAAELRLNVGLDLAYFKSQLPKLARAAAGFQLPIKVRIDGKQLQKELNRISGRREYRINLNDTSIKSAIANVKTLKRELEGLQSKSQKTTAAAAPMGAAVFKKVPSKGGPSAEAVKALYQQAAIEGIQGFIKGIKITKEAAALELGKLSKDAVKGLIIGLRKGRGSVESAAADLGDAAVDGLEDSLGIASPSFRLMKTGEFAAEGFEIGLTKGLKEAERSAVARMQAMLRALQGEAAKFGPALLMASGMGGGRGGDVRSAALMAGGMAGLFSPETEMQRERRQINERIAGRYGSSPTASFQGGGTGGQFRFGAAPASVYGGVPRQQLALPSAEMLEAGRTMKAFAQAADQANDLIRRKLANAERAATQGGHFSQAKDLGRFTAPALPPAGGTGGGSVGGGRRGGGGGMRFTGPSSFPELPGAGSVRELASEFGNATKQVLLFGTAYKGLAFLMDFPSQVKEAVASLQSFRNTLNAIIPDASKAAEANQFILDTVDKYNVPLKTARDGFVKLYASMEPAGFSGEDVQELFLGVSQAAATFGLSADKVDRVQYAFAQMASKGQIMSEELKGQLGDVLPGAMGLFAKAAGLEGPDAIQKFSKALEDGAFKGENMMALLRNVAKTMQKDFGPGAEGAAKSFQGLMNDMSTALTKLYEAFEPLAVEFLQGFVLPLTDGLKAAADGFTAFFKQTRANTKEGQAFANKLNELRAAFEGIKRNLAGVLQQFATLGKTLAPIAGLFVKLAGSPLVGYLMRLYLIILPLNIALKLMKGLWAANIIQLAIFQARVVTGTKTLTAFRTMMVATGKSAKALSLTIRSAFATTGIGIALIGLGILIEQLITLRSKMDEVKAAARQAAEAIQYMTGKQAASTEKQAQQDVDILRNLRERTKGKGARKIEVTKQEQEALTRSGQMPVKFAKEVGIFGQVTKQGIGTSETAVDAALGQALERRTLASNRRAEVEREDAASKAALETELEAVSLEGSGDEDGSKIKASSEAVLRIRRELLAIQEKLAMGEEGVNQLTLMKKELELELQQISEEEISDADKKMKKEEARFKHNKEVAKFTAENAKQIIDDLKKQAENRKKIDEILLKQKLASGEMSQKEYDIAMHLRDQLATRQQLKDLGATEAQLREFDNNQGPAPGTYDALLQTAESDLESLIDPVQQLDTIATGVGDTFATMFTDLATGASTAQEALGNMFSNLSDMFANMVQEIIAQWLRVQLIQGLGSIFGAMGGGGGATMGGSGYYSSTTGLGTAGPNFGLATGGVILGGIQPFAKGGVVKGPTLGLVGEGRHNEAIVPLPNGKSIPVEMGKGMGGDVNSSVVVNINNSGNAQSSTKGSQGNQLAKGIEGAVKDVIMREMRPGGMIASRR